MRWTNVRLVNLVRIVLNDERLLKVWMLLLIDVIVWWLIDVRWRV